MAPMIAMTTAATTVTDVPKHWRVTRRGCVILCRKYPIVINAKEDMLGMHYFMNTEQ